MKLKSVVLVMGCILTWILLSGCLRNDADYETLKETEELVCDGYSKLEYILESKKWSEKPKDMVLELYERIEHSFSIREEYKNELKDEYLNNYIDTIELINSIEIDPDNEELVYNGWNAFSDYAENRIILKFENLSDLRHEIAHLEEGTFLLASCGVDLGFVLEEGRASYKDGEALSTTEWIDAMSFNVSKVEEAPLLIENASGSYPAFEEIYKDMLSLGVSLEKLRKDVVINPEERITDELNEIYGEDRGTEYVKCLNEYIAFFNKHGIIDAEGNEDGETAIAVKKRLDKLYGLMKAGNIS